MHDSDDILADMKAFIAANSAEYGESVPPCATPSQRAAIARLRLDGTTTFSTLQRTVVMRTELAYEPGTIGQYMRFPKTYWIGPRGGVKGG